MNLRPHLQRSLDLCLEQAETLRAAIAEIDGHPAEPLYSIEGHILELVSNDYQLPKHALTNGGRQKRVAEARQVAMFLTRTITPLSFKEIGMFFGGRDHGTVIHAMRVVRNRMLVEESFATRINNFIQALA